MHKIKSMAVSIIVIFSAAYSEDPAVDNSAKEGQGYRIEKPGTITFTVGFKIKGKVEKPQVMIFLPKEKPVYKEITLTHSFYDEIMEALPFDPGEK
jgi:hypothetical protein